jgi:cytochrome b subunit of formate dehydrogenase
MATARTVFFVVPLLVGACLFGPLVQIALSQSNQDCLMCHSQEGGAPLVDVTVLKASAHANLACISCHAQASSLPHPEKLKAVDCSSCHSIEAEQYLSGRHGIKVGGNRPEGQVCGDCHGMPHAITSSSNASSPTYRVRIPSLCAKCHDDPARMGNSVLSQVQPYKSYMASVHGRAFAKGNINAAVCSDCHGLHALLPTFDRNSKIFRQNVPETCGKCHGQALAAYGNSVHGRAVKTGINEAPVCTDCHGEHLILSPTDPFSQVYPSSIKQTCGSCHAAERITSAYGLPKYVVNTYEQSYHGLAARNGSLTVANCASCHGHHDILPSSDPASSVNKANLSATCGKCHTGAGRTLAQGYVHSTPIRSRNVVVRYVIIFYLTLITLVIGGMFLHNLIDFVKKLSSHFRIMKSRAIEFRFVWSERLQHIVLTITFLVLAYSGFARRFPEAWWSLPFKLFQNPASARGMVHRIAAGIFIALCGYHLWFVASTRRGKEQLKALKPGFQDFRDLVATAKYDLGISKVPPAFGKFSYIEKSEYWALVWGSAIMIITGLALVFANFTLRYFPLWVAELVTSIHFYEAVLATLAILVWHFYWTIFDPNVYPMNWSWITGRSAEKRVEGPVPEKRAEKPPEEPPAKPKPEPQQHPEEPE